MAPTCSEHDWRNPTLLVFARRHRYALAISGVGHALLILAIDVIPRNAPVPSEGVPLRVYWAPAEAESSVEESPSETTPKSATEPPTKPTRAAETREASDLIPDEKTAAKGTPTDRERPPIDWLTAAQRAAERNAPESKSAFRSFLDIPKKKERSVPEPGAFSRAWSRAGSAYLTPEGEFVFWVSDDCWLTLESRSLLQQDIHAFHMAMVRCRGGTRRPRADLFEAMDEAKSQRLFDPLP